MPRLTAAERAELEARLADDADDDDDDEVEYGNPDGSYWRGKVRHAKRLGLYKTPDPVDPAADEGKPAGGAKVSQARFGGSTRRTS